MCMLLDHHSYAVLVRVQLVWDIFCFPELKKSFRRPEFRLKQRYSALPLTPTEKSFKTSVLTCTYEIECMLGYEGTVERRSGN